MARRNLIFFIALVAITLSSTESQQLEWPGTIKIGGSCERDIQCIKHGFCKIQRICACDTYYSPSLDMSTCHVNIGAPCIDKYEACKTMSNSECRQNVCTCKENFVIDINNASNCIMRPKAPGDTCQRPEECRDAMGMALCINEKCLCYTHHHFVNETGTCIRMRGPYESCKHDYECLIDEKNPDELVCKNGECASRNKGPANHQSTFVLTILTFEIIFRTFTR